MKTKTPRSRALPLLSTLTALMLLSVPVHAGQRVDETRAVDPDGVVDIENTFGSIVVTGWERNEVSVEGTLGDEAQDLEFKTRGSRTWIRVEIWGKSGGFDGSDLRIRVPKNSRVVAEGVNTDIEVSGVDGEIELQSINGSIDVTGAPEEASVSSVNGRVRIMGGGGDLAVSTVGGRILLEDVVGYVEAVSVSGDIEVMAEGIERIELGSVSGDIECAGKISSDARLDLSSHSGSIYLTLPDDISAEFDVSTFSGNIRNEHGPRAQRRHKHAPGKELSFTKGDGDARINVETFSGEIVLQK